MKKSSFMNLSLILAFLLLPLSIFAKDKVQPFTQASPEIKEYILKHFPSGKVALYKIDSHLFSKKYKVLFEDGTKLNFNKDNQIIEIDSKNKLPDTVIPPKLLTYVKDNYPKNYITEWELKRNKQEIELDNGLELEFTLEGDFIRIDD